MASNFIPALRFKILTKLYDFFLSVTFPEKKIKQALIDKGVAENRISNVLVSSGKTSEFTNDKAADEQDRDVGRVQA